jgi:hypothetical protein
LFLVRRGAPAAVDDELDSVVRGIGRRAAQGAEERWTKVGDAGNVVIEDRRVIGNGTVSLTKRTTGLAAKALDG